MMLPSPLLLMPKLGPSAGDGGRAGRRCRTRGMRKRAPKSVSAMVNDEAWGLRWARAAARDTPAVEGRTPMMADEPSGPSSMSRTTRAGRPTT